MSPGDAHIFAQNLTRLYRMGNHDVVGIRHVDLDLPTGEMVVLKGVSGSGKSTLLSLLAALDRPSSGRLTVAGFDLAGSTHRDLTRFRREIVGMIFQSFNLLPTLNVLENICLPAMLAGKQTGPVKEKALDLLDWLGLQKRASHYPNQLSGGEMQRTAIARALINDPAIILADEPTGNLDSETAGDVLSLLAELNREGQTIIMVTHNPEMGRYASRTIRVKDGMLDTA